MALLAPPDLVNQGLSKAPFIASYALEGVAAREHAPQRIGFATDSEMGDLVLKFGVGGWLI